MSKALVISCQYNQFNNAKLNGCFNDAANFINCLKRMDSKMTIIHMHDDLSSNSSLFPSRNNILQQFTNLCKSKENKLFFYFSGHGCPTTDYNKDEQSINFTTSGKIITQTQGLLQDSCIVSNDINFLNIVVDDELSNILKILPSNKNMYAFMDCCHSGTGLDLCNVNMGRFTTRFTSSSMPKLQNEINQKCSIVFANYPDKVDSIKANVILLSGTRDKDYAYESIYIDNIPAGHFTTRLCWLLNFGAWSMTVRQFYYNLIALINNPLQVPVLTCSKNINLDKTRMTDLRLYNNTKTLKSVANTLPGYKVSKVPIELLLLKNKKSKK